jgi:cob(I)alamin adenosyltransferase
MPIYTKKGDKGTTTLFDPKLTKGKRISKDSLRVWAIGAVDELNSYLGVCLVYYQDSKRKVDIKEVQKNLFIINSILAGAKLSFSQSKTKRLEKLIDEADKVLPRIKNFILPEGTEAFSHLYFARALCRKAERYLVTLSSEEKVKPEILKYINRLSDTLFTLAREENFKNNIKEEFWIGGKYASKK